MPTALITGATSGIGNAFARRLAANGHDLVLVARGAQRLGEVAAQLHERHGVRVEVIAADLSEPAQVEVVARRLRDGEPVDLLVNNAGFGSRQRFVGSDLAHERRLLAVLVGAVLELTHAALPGMVARGSGTVITVSSVAGFVPSGTYSAAKAWASTFTISLAGELAGTGVSATALCPGYVHTQMPQQAGLPPWAWLDVDALVATCLADVRRGRAVSVPSLRYKIAVALLRHLPLRAVAGAGRRRARRRAR